jgi:hypothetical protein
VLCFYNQTNPTRHLRLSFYTFNFGSPAGQGNGSYMEYGRSANDETPIELGKWIFVVGQAEPWISPTDLSTGCILWKQDVEASRELADKYGDFGVQPQAGLGSIRVGGTRETGFKGAIAHLAIWNRLLSADEVASIWTAGANDLSPSRRLEPKQPRRGVVLVGGQSVDALGTSIAINQAQVMRSIDQLAAGPEHMTSEITEMQTVERWNGTKARSATVAASIAVNPGKRP